MSAAATPTPPAASVAREDVTFPSGDEACAAWLYRPTGEGPHPIILLAHGLGGTRGMRLPAFAERFQAAGYACLVFDYRHFGDSGGQPRGLLDIRRQLADWEAALRYARAHPDLDEWRLVLWGTSFSGGHVLEVGARNPDVAAVIAQGPFTDGLASALVTNPISSLKVTALALADVARAALGRAPVEVALAGPPRSAALMTAPDAQTGVEQLLPPGDTTYRDRVCARAGLQIVRAFPGRRARRIAAPILFCLCTPDTVAPARAAERHAAKARDKEIRRYPYGHFDIYVGAAFEAVVADQLAFLRARVPSAAAPR